jgi:gag-polyprotein putative aspartyl protease
MKRTKQCFLVGSLLFQAGLAPGQPRVGLSNPNDSQEIAFQLRQGHLIVVEGRIATLDKLRCLIDTGATHSVVNQQIAQRFQLPREPGRIFKFERYATVEWAIFPEVQVGPISARNARLMVDGQPSSMPSDVDAIIGLDLLAKTSGFLIDYTAKVISFRNALSSQSRSLTCLTMQVMIQGHPVNLVADTGMHGFLLYENLRQRFPELKLKVEKTVRIGQLHAKQARISGLRLGSRESEAVVYLIRRPSQGIPSDVDGYFGMDALNASLVEFDFEGGRLRWN